MKTLHVALLASLLCGAAHADLFSAAEQAVVPFCDTQQQAERFAQVYTEGKSREAMMIVNTEMNDQSACGIQKLAFYRGDQSIKMRGPTGAFEIVRILVVGVVKGENISSGAPTVYYGVFAVPEAGA